jgi:hypothetical protein
MNDFPTAVKTSYYEELLLVGTQLGRVCIYDYFSLEMADYQLLHPSPVLQLSLVEEYKEERGEAVGGGDSRS